ncbi:CRISPR-associated protein [Clostridium tepidiprofundi DSM 19306]|uniref:CRISPR-associated protein n=1 Tax=Clostridium tepidiprofundi DSM 19306 TaxID=1121338 RepID=A0A151B365_9CLOT|nr:type I-B CRISPR-associated protein Cas8b1/Cst1 [Clostridium tepidiprofundi]KYH34087.1 CRISPR-associated protein [Clostridium tepidiprofundi DSM 19306]
MREIGIIKLELSDWLYNAGVVGIAKILETAGDTVKKVGNTLEFNKEVLENFEEKYFDYFVNKYKNFTSWYRIVSFEDEINNFDEDSLNDGFLKKLNDYIEYTKIRLKSASYKSGYIIINDKDVDILKEEKKLKKIKVSKKQSIKEMLPQIKEQFKNIEDIITYLKRDDVKKIILEKNVIYDIIARFWSGVSVLHTSNNTKDMCDNFKEYFIDNISNYLEADKKKYKYRCFSCDAPILKLSKPASYDLTWLNKMGVDMSRKSSHFWNFYGDSFICPVCNLVYSCIPAGFTVIRDRGIFINENSSMENIIKVNNTAIDNNTSFEELEDESYFMVADSLKQSEIERASKEIDNIQIVKLDSSNERRPYTFNMLSNKKLKVIVNHKKRLRSLIKVSAKVGPKEYINLYREVVERLYNNKNQFDIINKLLVLNLDGRFNRLGCVKSIIKINNDFIGGIMGKQGVYYKDIDKIQQLGYELREVYKSKKADNKMGGICYRLLNALKTKNQNKFMDTLVNSYMYAGKQIPVILLDALKGDNKLQTVGYAFILGLQGENGKLNSVKEEKGNE